MEIKPVSSHENAHKNFQKSQKMLKSIIKANDAIILEKQTKGIKNLAKRLVEKMQNDGVVTIPTKNIWWKANSLFSPRNIKFKTELTRENFKKILQRNK